MTLNGGLRSKFRLSAMAVLLCLGLGAPTVVWAEEGEERAELSQMEALQLIRAANDAFEEGNYEEAYEKYARAHEVLPEPTIRYRMGQSAQRLGRTEEAIYHFEAYLAEGDDPERVAVIEEALPELRAELQAEQQAEAAARAAEQQETRERAVREPADRAEGAGPAAIGWTVTGLGVAALATGGVFSFLQAGATERVNTYDKRAETASRDELEGLREDANGYHQAAVTSYIIGGVLTAAGAGFLVYNMTRGSEPEGLSFQGGVSPEGGFVSIGGRF